MTDPGVPPLHAALAAARELRLEHLVTGTFQVVDEVFTLTLQEFDVGSGKVVREVMGRATRRAELLDAVADVCRRFADELQPFSAVERGATRSLGPPTRSEDAYRAYSAALLAEAGAGRASLDLAQARFAEAVQADPAFADAHLRMAVSQQLRGFFGDETVDPRPALRTAAELESHFSERERMLAARDALAVAGRAADPRAGSLDRFADAVSVLRAGCRGARPRCRRPAPPRALGRARPGRGTTGRRAFRGRRPAGPAALTRRPGTAARR